MPLPAPEAAVVTRVKTLSAATSAPALSDDEVTAAILAHPAVDRNGVTADQPGWEPTWRIASIVAELWGTKAGKVAGDFNFGADGSNFSKGDVMAKCLEMEQLWAAKVYGSAATTAAQDATLGGLVVNG